MRDRRWFSLSIIFSLLLHIAALRLAQLNSAPPPSRLIEVTLADTKPRPTAAPRSPKTVRAPVRKPFQKPVVPRQIPAQPQISPREFRLQPTPIPTPPRILVAPTFAPFKLPPILAPTPVAPTPPPIPAAAPDPTTAPTFAPAAPTPLVPDTNNLPAATPQPVASRIAAATNQDAPRDNAKGDETNASANENAGGSSGSQTGGGSRGGQDAGGARGEEGSNGAGETDKGEEKAGEPGEANSAANGDGNSAGKGVGNESGDGEGNGDGKLKGDGSGDKIGAGNGDGKGRGDKAGDGSGNGDGNGRGDGKGDGNGKGGNGNGGNGSGGNGGGGNGGGSLPFGLGKAGGGAGPRHIVYVLDVSWSMEPRIDRAESELRAALKTLRPGESFGIVALYKKTRVFGKQLLPATPANVAQANRFLDKLKLGDGTNVEGALVRALSMRGVNVVVLITDGVPNYGEQDFDKLAVRVRALNTQKARIFTVGLVGKNPDGSDDSFLATRLLENIAAQNDGEFKLVKTE